MSAWINFKELRSKLRFEDVLRYYNVDVKIKGERATACCPLPTHPKRTDGKSRTPSLSVNLTRKIFRCFNGGCAASGNVLDFACKMEGFDPSDPVQFRKAALKVAEQFGIVTADSSANAEQATNANTKPVGENPTSVKPKPAAQSVATVMINAPLDFELKGVDPNHPYLRERGFTPETIQHFGLGYCNRGLMKGRIAVPLCNQGRVVGYAGRITKDSMISDTCPKYLFPGTRERDGIRYEFHKSELLYSAHHITQPVDDLCVVEGFPSVWWLWQAGYENVVALMGSSCSITQAKLIVELVKPAGRVWVFTDQDEAGNDCAANVLSLVGKDRWCKRVRCPERQPTDCAPAVLAKMLW